MSVCLLTYISHLRSILFVCLYTHEYSYWGLLLVIIIVFVICPVVCLSVCTHRSVGSWDLTPPDDPTGWRHIRLKTTGPNASGTTQYLSVSGLEVYGEVRGLSDEDLGMC